MGKGKRMLVAGSMFLLLLAFLHGLAQIQPPPPEERAVFWNKTESLPMGLYLRVPASFLLLRQPAGKLRDGDYVVYRPTPETVRLGVSRGWMEEGMMFLKRVGATEGGCWSVTEDLRFIVNGELRGTVFLEDREGRPMPRLLGDHVVPPGNFLPVGEALRSFDGRYTGPVPLENVRAVVFPILTGIHW